MRQTERGGTERTGQLGAFLLALALLLVLTVFAHRVVLGLAAVVAALDFASTAEAAEIVGGSSVYGKYISGLYGVGMMPSLLDQLDKGTIRGLVVTNQFDAGYFAVKKAVQAIEKEQERSQLSLESYYIEKDELRSKKYEKMLYPID